MCSTRGPFWQATASYVSSIFRPSSGLAGVVGAAAGALVRQDVELHLRRRPAVVAQDPYHLLLNRRHRRRRDLSIELLPGIGHVAGGLEANGTREPSMCSHLAEAFHVDHVPAPQHVDISRRLEHVLEAYRAVLVHCPVDAAMGILQHEAVAAPAFLAVKEVVCTAGSAYAASVAVKLVLRYIVVEEVTFSAEVFTEARPAV